jgi:hypothetical protein
MTTPADEQLLTAFSDAVRACATAPGRPNAALAELLATGLIADQSEPSTRTTGHPARASRKRPRMLLSTLTAKLAAAGVAAKAAAATGVVAVALTGAATTGVLPVQGDTVDAVVESGDGVATDPTLPTDGGTGGTTDEDATEDATDEDATEEDATEEDAAEEDATEEATEEDVTGGEPTETPAETPAEAPAGELTEDQWAQGPVTGQSHGDWVSEGARNGWVTGERVSDAAHRRNAERKAAHEEARRPAPEQPAVEQPAVEEPAVEEPAGELEGASAPAPAPAPAADDDREGNGNGNGNGHGRK